MSPSPGLRSNGRRGFTLVELLVVISIIGLLVAILLPSLQKARKQAKKVVCQTNLRSMAQAAFTYTTEWGVLPPTISNFQPGHTAPCCQDWLGIGDQFGAYVPAEPTDPGWPNVGNPKGFDAAPRHGVLYDLIKDEKAFLCAEDRPGTPTETPEGGGGNGKFSYTMFANMGLWSLEKVPTRRREVTGGARGGSQLGERLSKRAFAKIPLFVEEHPMGINSRFGTSTGGELLGHMEGNFNFTDNVCMRHPPFDKVRARNNQGQIVNIRQGMTQIGFADGHVEDLRTKYQVTADDIKKGKPFEDDIPFTAPGLMWYFGIDDSNEQIIQLFD